MSEYFNLIAIDYLNILHGIFLLAFAYISFRFLRDWWCGTNGLSLALGLFMLSLTAGELWSILLLTLWQPREFIGVFWRAVQLTSVLAAIVFLIIQHRRTLKPDDNTLKQDTKPRGRQRGESATTSGSTKTKRGRSSKTD